MKINEIENKYFFCKSEAVSLLEAFSNPSAELDIKFTERLKEFSDEFYNAVVKEKASNTALISIDFVLRKESDAIEVGNIEPLISGEKLVHTSLNVQRNGVDMGTSAMRWVMKNIKDFALSKGFNIKNISTSTRYTGARAFNDPGPDQGNMPKNFSVNREIKETACYDCATGILTVKTAKY